MERADLSVRVVITHIAPTDPVAAGVSIVAGVVPSISDDRVTIVDGYCRSVGAAEQLALVVGENEHRTRQAAPTHRCDDT
jgi:hypothetical protein